MSNRSEVMNCLSANRKMSVKAISDKTGISKTTVRKTIRILVRWGYPIASDNKGFWVMTTKREMQEYLNRLQKVQVALSERIADAYHAYEHTYK